MLFPILPSLQTEPMRWTGEVRAFAYFASPECLPEERLATVYVARKIFEDGSTVTIVRNVPSDRHPTLRSGMAGEGLIERDPSGLVVRLDAYTELRPHGGSYSVSGTHMGRNGGGTWHASAKRAAQPNPVTLSRLALQIDPKTEMLAGSWQNSVTTARLEFSQPRSYWLDPLEAVAFGSPASMTAGWLLPSGAASAIENRSRVVGMMLAPTLKSPYPLEMDGVRELFRRIDLTAVYPGAQKAFPPPPPGALLFHMDGRLAAYVPSIAIMDSPGTVFADGFSIKSEKRPIAAPPVALKGKLKDLWDKGIDIRQDHMASFGLFVPAPVSPGERQALMSAIGERSRPETPEDPPAEPPSS